MPQLPVPYTDRHQCRQRTNTRTHVSDVSFWCEQMQLSLSCIVWECVGVCVCACLCELHVGKIICNFSNGKKQTFVCSPPSKELPKGTPQTKGIKGTATGFASKLLPCVKKTPEFVNSKAYAHTHRDIQPYKYYHLHNGKDVQRSSVAIMPCSGMRR